MTLSGGRRQSIPFGYDRHPFTRQPEKGGTDYIHAGLKTYYRQKMTLARGPLSRRYFIAVAQSDSPHVSIVCIYLPSSNAVRKIIYSDIRPIELRISLSVLELHV